MNNTLPNTFYVPKSRKTKRKPVKSKPQEKLYSIIRPNEANRKYYLGNIWLGNTNNIIPEYSESKIEFKNEIVLLHFDSVTCIVHVTNEIEFLIDLFSLKIFSFEFVISDNSLSTCVYLTKLPIVNPSKKIQKTLKIVFNLIFNISVEMLDENDLRHVATTEDINDIYANIKEECPNMVESDVSNVQSPHLKVNLYPFQMRTVQWMISMEQPKNVMTLHPLYEKVVLQSNVSIFYHKWNGEVKIEAPMILQTNRGGILADEMGLGKTIEVFSCILNNCKVPKSELTSGRLIIDTPRRKRRKPTEDHLVYTEIPNKMVKEEKKSGKKSSMYIALRNWYEETLASTSKKTVPEHVVSCTCGSFEEENLIYCIDCARRQHKDCLGYEDNLGEYICPQCWNKRPLLECKGTLIVCPTSLKKQWSAEMAKHISGGLRVLIYEGFTSTPIYPKKMLVYDVVITTYAVLQAELRLTENERETNLRKPPKYSKPCSSIAQMIWWRLCFDEAQMIDCQGMISKMAEKLSAVNRWAVTGTPISRGVSDLYNLINFLHLEPFNEENTWKQSLYIPYLQGTKKPMFELLGKILWRTSKEDIANQISIPKQNVVEYWSDFTPVERYFYNREHELSTSDFSQKVRRYNENTPLKLLNKTTFKELLDPLLSLRKACAHHTTVKGRYLTTRKPVSSMLDLLEALVLKNMNESEDYLRMIVSSLNGIAGISILMNDNVAAKNQYLEVLELMERYTSEGSLVKLKIDKLQQIHTLHNLSILLKEFPDDQNEIPEMQQKLLNLQEEYMSKFEKNTLEVLNEVFSCSSKILELQNSFILSAGHWFAKAIEILSNKNLFREYKTRIENNLGSHIKQVENLEDYVLSPPRLLYLIATWNDLISELRDDVIRAIDALYIKQDSKLDIPDDIITKAIDCHLRPEPVKAKKNKPKCPCCKAKTALNLFECKLFSMTKKEDKDSNKGTWKPSISESALKIIHSVVNTQKTDADIIQDGKIHLNILTIMRKEFKEISKLYQHLDAQICAKDELNMSKIRFSLKQADETPQTSSKVPNMLKQLTDEIKSKDFHLLEAHELDFQKIRLIEQKQISTANLQRNLGSYSYLQTLKMQQFSGQKPDPCPICRCVLEKHWNILKCGHCYCLECVEVLISQGRCQMIVCSICRQKHHIKYISYLQTDEVSTKDENEVKGNFSTKMGDVVRLIFKLKKEDEHVKVLIFSHWIDVLKVLKNILDQNNITGQLFMNQASEKGLHDFKDEKKNITVLLLPVNFGARGLNLIEATQVIFMEPFLDPGEELQAIGRVHRIGQTKSTVVHKFLVKYTIEENIHNATTADAKKWDKNKITMSQISSLFEKVK